MNPGRWPRGEALGKKRVTGPGIEERYDIVLKVMGQTSLPSSVVQVQRVDKECGDPDSWALARFDGFERGGAVVYADLRLRNVGEYFQAPQPTPF